MTLFKETSQNSPHFIDSDAILVWVSTGQFPFSGNWKSVFFPKSSNNCSVYLKIYSKSLDFKSFDIEISSISVVFFPIELQVFLMFFVNFLY